MQSLQVVTLSVTDPELGLQAFVVQDSLIGGRAMGGIRITSAVSLAEVAALARRMTLKLALAELPIGGAKAGIVLTTPPGEHRDAQLRSFGNLAGPLIRGGVYLGADMGCSYRDRDLIFDAAGYKVATTKEDAVAGSTVLPCSWAELWRRCAAVTGYGVAQSILTAADVRGLPAARRTVCIQGFGVVGRGAAQLLTQRGFLITGVADLLGTIVCPAGLPIDALVAITDPQGLINRSQLPPGCTAINTPDAWLDVDAGVLLLAAGSDAIFAQNVSRVRADIIAEGANLPTTLEAQDLLAQRGVDVLPDILANIGGAMVTALVLCQQVPVGETTEGLVDWLYREVTTRVERNVLTTYSLRQHAPGSLHRICSELAQQRARSLLTRRHRLNS